MMRKPLQVYAHLEKYPRHLMIPHRLMTYPEEVSRRVTICNLLSIVMAIVFVPLFRLFAFISVQWCVDLTCNG